jgi:hypothetical protein
MRSTGETEELKEYLRKNIIDKLGLFPHKKVTLNGTKKQTTRNIKVACDCCNFSFRTSRQNLAIMDFEPDCLACSEGTLHEA